MIDMTTFKITTFADLIQLIRKNPDLRYELQDALGFDSSFRELRESMNRLTQAEAALQEEMRKLTEGQQLLQKLLSELTQRVNGLETRLEKVETRLEKVETRLEKVEIRLDTLEVRVEIGFADAATDRKSMKHTLGILKGKTYESEILDHATSIFGRYMRRGHNGAIELSDWLQTAEEAGNITENEYDQVYAADLLWSGKLKTPLQDIVLVLEISWLVLPTDLDRAIDRANILRKTGLKALPVVAGVEFDESTTQLALQQGVAVVLDRSLDKPSWLSALAQIA